MRSRFQVDPEIGHDASPTAFQKYDAAGAEFAASSEQAHSATRFVVDEEGGPPLKSDEPFVSPVSGPEGETWNEPICNVQPERCEHGDWRDEITARVSQYRERRGSKEPRYPSLRLKFDGHEPSWRSASAKEPLASALGTAALSLSPEQTLAAEEIVADDQSAKIIEFPRSLIVPSATHELAEPILDRPRIIEAPELVPPPPALGGISIEPSTQEQPREPIDVPLQPASISRRFVATMLDGIIVSAALAWFAYIFFRITADSSSWIRPNLIIGVLPGVFWFLYQYVFAVYCGRTLGTALTRMKVRTFAGDATAPNLRRWRVLTSMLSAVSLGLGYLWCFLDEDQLCWHDRITRTYLAPQTLNRQ